MDRRQFLKIGGGGLGTLFLSACGLTRRGPLDRILREGEKIHPLFRPGNYDPNGIIYIGDPVPVVDTSWGFYGGDEGLDPYSLDLGPNDPTLGRNALFCHTLCGLVDTVLVGNYPTSDYHHDLASNIEQTGEHTWRIYKDPKIRAYWLDIHGNMVREITMEDIVTSIKKNRSNIHRGVEVVNSGSDWVDIYVQDGTPESRGLFFPIVPSSGEQFVSAGLTRYDTETDTLNEMLEDAWGPTGILYKKNTRYHAGEPFWGAVCYGTNKPGENVLEQLLKGEMDIAIRTNLFSNDQYIDKTPAFIIADGLGVRILQPKEYPCLTVVQQMWQADLFPVIFKNLDPTNPDRYLPFSDPQIMKKGVAAISKAFIKEYCIEREMYVDRCPDDIFYMMTRTDPSEGGENGLYGTEAKLEKPVKVKIAGRSVIVVEAVSICLERMGFEVTQVDDPKDADVNIEEKTLQAPHYFLKIAWDPKVNPKNQWGYYDPRLLEILQHPDWKTRIAGIELDGVVGTVVSRYSTVYNRTIQVADPSTIKSPLSVPWFYALRKRAA